MVVRSLWAANRILVVAGPRNHLDLQRLLLRRERPGATSFGHRQDPCQSPTELDLELPVHWSEDNDVD